jgi:hypothetical protein
MARRRWDGGRVRSTRDKEVSLLSLPIPLRRLAAAASVLAAALAVSAPAHAAPTAVESPDATAFHFVMVPAVQDVALNFSRKAG